MSPEPSLVLHGCPWVQRRNSRGSQERTARCKTPHSMSICWAAVAVGREPCEPGRQPTARVGSHQCHAYLHARILNIACDDHGVVKVTVQRTTTYSRSTLLFDRLALDVLRQCDERGPRGSYGSAARGAGGDAASGYATAIPYTSTHSAGLAPMDRQDSRAIATLPWSVTWARA